MMHLVKPNETLRELSFKYNIPAWYIIKANKKKFELPNYPLYVNVKYSIVDNLGPIKTLNPNVLDQPAAEYYATWRNGLLTVTVIRFPPGSNWFVVVGGKKFKIKVITKNPQVNSFKVPIKPLTFVLKNQTTDMALKVQVR